MTDHGRAVTAHVWRGGRAFNTEKTYAGRIALYLSYCWGYGVDWSSPNLAQLMAMMRWLVDEPAPPPGWSSFLVQRLNRQQRSTLARGELQPVQPVRSGRRQRGSGRGQRDHVRPHPRVPSADDLTDRAAHPAGRELGDHPAACPPVAPLRHPGYQRR